MMEMSVMGCLVEPKREDGPRVNPSLGRIGGVVVLAIVVSAVSAGERDDTGYDIGIFGCRPEAHALTRQG